MIHHLLRDHGQLLFDNSKDILSSLVRREVSPSNDPIISDLREAMVYAVMKKNTKSLAMIVMKSLQKDWFLSFLNYFNLHVNDLFPPIFVFQPSIMDCIILFLRKHLSFWLKNVKRV